MVRKRLRWQKPKGVISPGSRLHDTYPLARTWNRNRWSCSFRSRGIEPFTENCKERSTRFVMYNLCIPSNLDTDLYFVPFACIAYNFVKRKLISRLSFFFCKVTSINFRMMVLISKLQYTISENQKIKMMFFFSLYDNISHLIKSGERVRENFLHRFHGFRNAFSLWR